MRCCCVGVLVVKPLLSQHEVQWVYRLLDLLVLMMGMGSMIEPPVIERESVVGFGR
jgi:hypothetical protein